MIFPSVLDISTKNIIRIDASSSINEAIDLMIINNHRDVIVIDKKRFFVITANDVIRLKLEAVDFDRPLTQFALEEVPKITADKNVLDALELVQQSKEYLCVIDHDNELLGIVTNTDVITSIDPETLMENYRLGDLLKINKKINKASRNISVYEVLKSFSSGSNDCVIIVDEDSIPEGILTTKDIMYILDRGLDLSITLENYMTKPVLSINEDATVKDAINFVQKNEFNRVVVTSLKGELIGIINQKELISLSYSKWAMLVKNYQSELRELNTILEKRASKYKQMAFTDNLTGLYNRYKLFELFDVAAFSMSKKGDNMILAVVDIDHFKKINDKYGHDVGDHILVRVSNIFLACLRSTDVVARWGGEEFVFLLTSLSHENAQDVLEKTRERVKAEKFEIEEPISVSIGWTLVDIGDKFDDAFKRADSALYVCKDTGRDKVMFL